MSVLYETSGAVGLIQLNRPHRKNAINQTLLVELYDALERADADDSIAGVVITGKGNSFCSGIDLECFATDNLLNPRGDGHGMLEVFQSIRKPIIGAIRGYAITGGFELALNCDFLLADPTACFMDTHAKLGIHPGWGMTQLLQQAVGRPRALQISLTGEKIPVQKALAWGLVNEVVEEETLLPRCFALVEMMAANNRPMVQIVKDLIEVQDSAHLKGALEVEGRGFSDFASQFMNVG
ncbi:MAG: enoyl-CoA hydratase-related protein [Desulfobacterales bacterium]|nr:enoyl-CoA hydratase-related protein [Desulfobacterales bacterium]